jgi:uncharacterized protein with ParB-like and HNH nuclease domain
MKFTESNMNEYLYTPGRFFEIPEFQRPYSWQASNVVEFLNDLESCINENKYHYFGTIVQVKDTDSINSNAIIDGQQRVTTSLLMISAIYHLSQKDSSLLENSELTVDGIEYQFLINKDLDNRRVKLRTVTIDNEVLQHIFNEKGDEAKLTLKDRQSNVYQVYAQLREYFKDKRRLDRYITALTHFEVAVLTLVSGDDNPQRVFESINSTGKPLTSGDKIRNFALMLNSKESRNHVYEEYWKPLERTLTDVNRDDITDFFRYYLISKKQTNIKLPEVYTEFKDLFNKNVGSKQAIESLDEFYGDISRSLRFYELLRLVDTNLINKNSVEWANHKDIAETIFKMRYIKVDLYIPFAMSALSYHADGGLTDTQLVSVFKLIESYFSRRIIVNFYTTSVDRFMASLHRQTVNFIKRDPTADYVEVLKYIILNQTGQTRIPDDAEYEKAIRVYPMYEQHGKGVLSYILSAAESNTKESKSALHLIAEDNKDITIEHVMPQTLNREEWKTMLGDQWEYIHEQYLHTLSNLTLTGYNSDYSNRPYQEKMILETKNKQTGEVKKVGFKFSPLPINSWIARHDQWNEDTLKERQDMWVSELRNVWTMPITTFHPATGASVHLLDDISLRGESIRSISMFGDKTSVGSWAEAIDVMADALYEKYPDLIEVVSGDEWLAKYLKQDATAFRSSIEIGDSGYFIATSNNTDTKLRIIRRIATLLEIASGDIEAEIGIDDTIEDEA